nr:hypothetical protein [Tanacetum cinerariifolium]
LNVGREEGHDEEEDEDVNINQGRGIQMTQEVEDSHVTLTPVNPDGQQQSSSVSSQFVTSMLNATPDAEMESIFETTSQMDSDKLCEEAQKENDEFLKTIDENMQKIIKEQVKEQVKRNLYKALVEAYEFDKIILETYEKTITLKRRHDDDADKDEDPSAGPDRGSKRRREGKEPELASAPTETATRRAGRSTQGSQSRQTSASESIATEEPMQTTFEMEEPSHLEFETGADDQPIIESSRHPEWFSQQQKPPTPDHDLNKTFSANHGIQSWISDLAKISDSRSSFNELMDTLVDFSNFLINRLNMDTLTLKVLVGPTYELLNGSCKSQVELEYHLEEVYKDTTDQLDWVNPEGRKYTTSVTKTKAADYEHIKWIEDLVPRTMWIQELIGYENHALWGVSHWGRKRQQFYGFAVTRESARKLTNLIVEERFAFNISLRMFTRSIVIQRHVEDLQLGVESYQMKLNLTKPDTYRSDLKRKDAYIAYFNPRGFIYQNKDKKNRLMRIDELHKFSDGTLTDVRTALDDRLKGIQMLYLPHSIWRKSDKDRAAAMIQATHKRLKTRRIMRSLERFVRGRLNIGDFRML